MVVRIFGLFENKRVKFVWTKKLTIPVYVLPIVSSFFAVAVIFLLLFAAASFFLLKNEISLLRGRTYKKNMLYCVSFYPQVSFLF